METKKCSYCGEEIMASAKKCRHCGEWLDKEAAQAKITVNKPNSDTVAVQAAHNEVKISPTLAIIFFICAIIYSLVNLFSMVNPSLWSEIVGDNEFSIDFANNICFIVGFCGLMSLLMIKLGRVGQKYPSAGTMIAEIIITALAFGFSALGIEDVAAIFMIIWLIMTLIVSIMLMTTKETRMTGILITVMLISIIAFEFYFDGRHRLSKGEIMAYLFLTNAYLFKLIEFLGKE